MCFFLLSVPTCDGESILYIQINSFILAYTHSSILVIIFLLQNLNSYCIINLFFCICVFLIKYDNKYEGNK